MGTGSGPLRETLGAPYRGV